MKFLKSKTMIFAALLAIFGVVETQMNVFQSFLSPQAYGIFTIAVSVIVAVLRLVTTQPIDEK